MIHTDPIQKTENFYRKRTWTEKKPIDVGKLF
jgi:hypothetical protein